MRQVGEAGSNPKAVATILAAGALLFMCVAFFLLDFGWAPVLIVGLSGFAALPFSYRFYPVEPAAQSELLTPFLFTVAGFEVHLIEEYFGHYGPAISRLFSIGWTDRSFVVIAFALTAALSLLCAALHQRRVIAGVAVSLFLFTRLAEGAMFIFPLLRPALQPNNVQMITARVTSGSVVTDMPNYYAHATGHYYFPGMYTVLLPIVPALITLVKILRISHRELASDKGPRISNGTALQITRRSHV